MGIGHVAVGLGLKRADPRTNVGWLIFAALLPDFLLGVFALAGWETYQVPPGYASGHYLLFTFPWSHGLLPDLLWAAIASGLAWAITKRRGAPLAVAVAVLSHFLLDGIVHVKGLPLLDDRPPVFGLGLWRHLPLELTLEAGMAAVGLCIYLDAVRSYPRARKTGIVVFVAVFAALLVFGQATATEVPPRAGLIAGWLLSPVLIAAIGGRLDRNRPHRAVSTA